MTPEQLSALALDHHVVVHANAGAGKTSVLVERFVAIVLSGRVDSIEQIVATTFTIKAAAEMRSRIRTRLVQLIADGRDPFTHAPFDAQTSSRLTEFAHNIGSARITTLHSFCASLLRKYAYASGIDVDAQELSQRRAYQWRSDAMRTTIRTWLQGTVALERRERLLVLLDELDVYTAEETILQLMNSTERRDRLAMLFMNGDEAVSNVWSVHISNIARRTALTLLLHAQAELLRLQLDVGANVQAIIENNDSVLDALRRAEADDVAPAVHRALARLDHLYTKGGTPHRVKSKRPFDEGVDMSPIDETLLKSLRAFVADSGDESFERQQKLVRTALEVSSDAAALYRETKADRNAIDFDDMMDLTRTMLQRSDIAADVQRGIRFLMVDEFQDTSPVQYEILSALVPDFGSPSASPLSEEGDPSTSPRPKMDGVPSNAEGAVDHDATGGAPSVLGRGVNLFIVGDAKQSIYGFRGADVRLFMQASRDIVKANKRNGKPDGRVVLSASFRMSPNLLPIVNGICAPVFAQSTDGIEYTPLTGGRQGAAALLTGTCTIVRTDTDALAEDSRFADDDYSNDDGGSPEGETPGQSKALVAEMRHVAQRIVNLISNTNVLVSVGKRETPLDGIADTRLVGPGDIAVLVRSASGVMAVGAALRDAGVPYQTHSGRAFFSRPEVADIRNLLIWSTDTDDDLAFAALVRSPLVLLYDADIVRIAATVQRGSLWSRMNALVESGNASADVVRAHRHLTHWTTAVHVLAPTDFVQLALAQSNWHATLANDPRRSQILLNVEKVIELILAEQDTSNASLRDIIETLTPPASDLEGDRPFAADPNAVQVMTLHAAKGLEFPVVVLANIASRSRTTSTAWSDEIGLTFSQPKKLITFAEPAGKTVADDILHRTNRMIGQGAASDEDRRLLYVGLTRAKDHLLISLPYSHSKTTGDEKRSSVGLAPLMYEPLEAIACNVVEWDGQSAHYVSSVEPPTLLDASAALEATSWLDIVTATDLLASTATVDAADATDESATHEAIRADHGPAYGTLMHDILQRIVVAGDIDADERSDIIERFLATRLVSVDAHTLARTEIADIMGSAFVREHMHHFAHANVESTLLAPLDSTILQGMMDVRFKSDAHTMEVWDWKTNIIRNESDIVALATAYAAQAQVYAWLCLESFSEVTTVRTRFLFTKATRQYSASWVVTRDWTREMTPEIKASIVESVQQLIQRRTQRTLTSSSGM